MKITIRRRPRASEDLAVWFAECSECKDQWRSAFWSIVMYVADTHPRMCRGRVESRHA